MYKLSLVAAATGSRSTSPVLSADITPQWLSQVPRQVWQRWVFSESRPDCNMTAPAPSLQVLTARWRLMGCDFFLKNTSVCVCVWPICVVWFLTHTSVSSRSNTTWKAFCLGTTAALWVTVLLLFGAAVTVAYPEVCGLVLKNALGNGQLCEVLSLSNWIDFLFPSWHSPLTVKATVMWRFSQIDWVCVCVCVSVSGS